MKKNFTKFLLFGLVLFLSVPVFAQRNIILTPENSTESFTAVAASFGSLTPENACDFDLSAEVVLTMDTTGSTEVCTAVSTDVSGKIALIDRGSCNFTTKVREAQTAGAIAAVVCNNEAGEGPIIMGGDDVEGIEIPAMMISKEDCDILKSLLEAADSVVITLSVTTLQEEEEGMVFWGDQPGQGDFAGGLNDWTTVGITNDTSVWLWSPNGAGRGDLIGNSAQFSIISPTGCDGAAIFDSDLYNAGVTGAGPYPDYAGELISPTIDCSDCPAIAVQFYQYNVPLNGTTQIAFSYDDGATWSAPLDVETENAFTANETNLAGTELKKFSIPNGNGASQLKIKFIYDGDFYFWMIDDVKIVEAIANDMAITDVFYTPSSAVQPESVIATDTFLFQVTASNLGANDQNNLVLNANIVNLETEEVVHAASETFGTIEAGVIDTALAIGELFAPELPVGEYAINYELVLENEDGDPDNNSETVFFVVSENLFAKELGLGSLISRNGGNPHSYACIYGIPAATQEKFVTDQITFWSYLPEDEGGLDGKITNLYLMKVSEEVDAAYSNFNFESSDVTADGQLDYVGFFNYTFDAGSGSGAELGPVSTPLEDFDTGEPNIPLEAGQRYFLISDYQGDNSDVFQVYSDGVDYDFISTLLLTDRWYTGYAGDNGFAPILRMSIALSTSTDEQPLPDNVMAVFPNPADQQIQVQFDFEKQLDATVTLADISGRVIEYRNLPLLNETVTFNAAALPAGMYLVRVATPEGTKTIKVSVQH